MIKYLKESAQYDDEEIWFSEHMLVQKDARGKDRGHCLASSVHSSLMSTSEDKEQSVFSIAQEIS